MSVEPAIGVSDFQLQAAVFWKQRGGRMTIVRNIICGLIADTNIAFVADELWVEARKQDKGISMASIYRTLSDLVLAGLLQEIRGSQGERSFVKSAAAATSGHLICKDCHRIIPLKDDCLALREGTTIRGMGFETGGMHLQIEATCAALKQTGACENR